MHNVGRHQLDGTFFDPLLRAHLAHCGDDKLLRGEIDLELHCLLIRCRKINEVLNIRSVLFGVRVVVCDPQ